MLLVCNLWLVKYKCVSSVIVSLLVFFFDSSFFWCVSSVIFVVNVAFPVYRVFFLSVSVGAFSSPFALAGGGWRASDASWCRSSFGCVGGSLLSWPMLGCPCAFVHHCWWRWRQWSFRRAGVGCLAYSSLLYVVVEHHAEILGGRVHGLFEVPFCYFV